MQDGGVNGQQGSTKAYETVVSYKFCSDPNSGDLQAQAGRAQDGPDSEDVSKLVFGEIKHRVRPRTDHHHAIHACAVAGVHACAMDGMDADGMDGCARMCACMCCAVYVCVCVQLCGYVCTAVRVCVLAALKGSGGSTGGVVAGGVHSSPVRQTGCALRNEAAADGAWRSSAVPLSLPPRSVRTNHRRQAIYWPLTFLINSWSLRSSCCFGDRITCLAA